MCVWYMFKKFFSNKLYVSYENSTKERQGNLAENIQQFLFKKLEYFLLPSMSCGVTHVWNWQFLYDSISCGVQNWGKQTLEESK